MGQLCLPLPDSETAARALASCGVDSPLPNFALPITMSLDMREDFAESVCLRVSLCPRNTVHSTPNCLMLNYGAFKENVRKYLFPVVLEWRQCECRLPGWVCKDTRDCVFDAQTGRLLFF